MVITLHVTYINLQVVPIWKIASRTQERNFLQRHANQWGKAQYLDHPEALMHNLNGNCWKMVQISKFTTPCQQQSIGKIMPLAQEIIIT